MTIFRFITVVGMISLIAFSVYSQLRRQGLDPSKEPSQYTHEVWLKKQGMPQNSARGVVQTSDGYVWIGTEEGLARFDGVRFVVFNPRNTPGLSHKNIRALFQSSNGWLWAGTDGGGLIRFDGTSWKTFTMRDGLPSEYVTSFHEDGKKRLWVGTSMGVCVFNDTTFQAIPGRDRIVSVVTSLTEDRDGTLLAGSSRGIFALRNGMLEEYPVPGVRRLDVLTMTRGKDGSVWVGTWGDGLVNINGSVVKRYSRKDGLTSDRITAVYCSPDGSLWIGTVRAGLLRLADGRISSTSPGSSLASSEIRSILEDVEGNLWVGTFGNGLHKLSDGKFTTHLLSTIEENNIVWTVYEDRRFGLLAGTADGKVYRKEGNAFKVFLDFSKPDVKWVQSLLVDRTGTLWVALSKGLFSYRSGSLRRVLGGNVKVHSLFEDRQGTVWAGTNSGLYKIRRGEVTHFTPEQGLAGIFVRAIKEDKQGNLWIGTSRGLSRFSQGTFRNYTTADGLAPHAITSILEGENDELWIGTLGGGLTRFADGKVTKYTTLDGLPDDNVYEILDGRDGYLWMSSNNGVFRVRKEHLRSFTKGGASSIPYELYGDGDGMISSECNGGNQPSGWRTSDGRLWFGNTMGIVSVDPLAMPKNSLPPAVALEEFLVDRVEHVLTDGVVIPAGSRDFQFNFTALSFVAPGKVRFKFMLEGFDDTWIDAGSRRSAFYNNIPAGSYRFRVIAANNDGVWNDTGASAGFTLEPFFYQTGWFAGVCVLLVLGGAWRGFRMYQAYQHRKLISSELETQLAKAQLQTLRMQLQPHFLFNTLNGIMVLIKKNPQGARAMVSHLSDLLRLTLDHHESQEVPLHEELEILDKYLEIERTRFRDRLTVHIQVDKQVLDAMVPTFILQPLVENSIKHGVSKIPGPASISISARGDKGILKLTVKDNGSGMGRRGKGELTDGIGLKNTRARLQQMYGSGAGLELKNGSPSGLEVVVALPLNVRRNGKRRGPWND